MVFILPPPPATALPKTKEIKKHLKQKKL